MPILFSKEICPISQKRFHEIDFVVMGLAFDIHRDLGSSLLDESVYQVELAHRCLEAGFCSVKIEEPIDVSFQSFRKVYAIDLLVENAAVFELKVARAIGAEHRAQTLKYLLLTNLHHGKVGNFSPGRVEHAFVSTTLTRADRAAFKIDASRWLDIDHESAEFRTLVEAIAAEWGTFLEVGLYVEAVAQLRGGEEVVIHPVELTYKSRPLGTQRLHLLNPVTAFQITAITRQVRNFEHALQKFLYLTPLQRIQWVNFNHHEVWFQTISRTSMVPTNLGGDNR